VYTHTEEKSWANLENAIIEKKAFVEKAQDNDKDVAQSFIEMMTIKEAFQRAFCEPGWRILQKIFLRHVRIKKMQI
jgi:hypothetical protein